MGNLLQDSEFESLIEERFGVSSEVLMRYADARKAGSAFIASCKPGDTVYAIEEGDIKELECGFFDVTGCAGGVCVTAITSDKYSNAIACFEAAEFGVSVFADKEEAHKTLRLNHVADTCILNLKKQPSPACWEYIFRLNHK